MTYTDIYRMIYRDELYHHGILGMKWGVRRFQPYPKGHKGGKEVGQATKVKQRDKKAEKAAKLTSRTAKKFEKLDRSIESGKKTVDKYYAKAEKKTYSVFSTQKGIDKAFGRATQANKVVNRLEYKGTQYYQKKLRQFEKLGISMNDDLQKKGEEYLAAVRKNSAEIYRTTLEKGFHKK